MILLISDWSSSYWESERGEVALIFVGEEVEGEVGSVAVEVTLAYDQLSD